MISIKNKKTETIVSIAASLLLLTPQFSANGQKSGFFYCHSNKIRTPIAKASIRSVGSGFIIRANFNKTNSSNDMVFEIDNSLEIKKYGSLNDLTPWQEIESSKKPYFTVKQNGDFILNFFSPGCGRDSFINGKLNFVGDAKSKIFNR
jgi:hypothetical protein